MSTSSHNSASADKDKTATITSSSNSMQAKDLTRGHIGQQIIRLAAPIVGGAFIQMAYNFTDMAWLGRLGNKEVAATGVIGVLLWLSFSISTLTKIGSEVCVAQGLGSGDENAARNYASHNTTISFIIGLCVVLGLLFLGPLVVGLYQLEADIHAMAVRYLRIVSIGVLPLFLTVTIGGIYNASGRSNIPFKVNAIGLILNMILDPLLIFVVGWGTEGAAWATTLSEFVVIALLLYRLRQKDQLLNCFPLLTRLQGAKSLRIFKVGFPAALLNALFVFVSVYMGRLCSLQGSEIGVAVLTAGGQLEAITWNASQGFGTALSAFVGQNYAAGKIHRVFKGYRTTLAYTALFGCIGTILFFFWGQELFALIVPHKPTYVEGGRYLRIAAYSQLFMMLEITAQGLFYGTGRSFVPATISIVGNYARIPLAFLFMSWGWGLAAIWWAISATSICKGLTAIACLPWLKKRLQRY